MVAAIIWRPLALKKWKELKNRRRKRIAQESEVLLHSPFTARRYCASVCDVQLASSFSCACVYGYIVYHRILNKTNSKKNRVRSTFDS